ncbi:hypothetical protein BI095_gp39 [Enterobacter phage Tyrion]|uniref:hypothetical protein n=1 Tax=Enterobacter phage Tyrion TaxID=1864623 RepID=UPI0007FB6B9E|nr:hypothetical protein BI095_gp39 [Enterobacter phage Tyrion]ANN86211.1 hypothetical protein BI095_gp39 [Enterobacter phage Tyrion]
MGYLVGKRPFDAFLQRAKLPAHQPASCNAVPTVNDFPLHDLLPRFVTVEVIIIHIWFAVNRYECKKLPVG